MTEAGNSELDLHFERLIKAPRTLVWQAWADPAKLAQWWLPEPALCRVLALELRPGGALRTQMSQDGAPFEPHIEGCFLDVEPGRRLVFTDMLTQGWRPAPGMMTAFITFEDHDQGTVYRARVLHQTKADRDRHEEMGFYDGWGTVAAQLARLVEA